MKFNLPLLYTFTVLPGLNTAVCKNQGNPKHTNISNTLLPIALDTAMSP